MQGFIGIEEPDYSANHSFIGMLVHTNYCVFLPIPLFSDTNFGAKT